MFKTTHNKTTRVVAMNENEILIPQGAIIFQDDGTIELHLADGITPEDKESIVLASDFFQYAMQREDWLEVFICDYEDSEEQKNEKFNKAFSKSDLHVIPGGQLVPMLTGAKN